MLLTWKKICLVLVNSYKISHKRFCHFNFHNLKLLKKNDMVQGLPEIHTEVDPCESYKMGKQHRKSFSKGVSWRASVLLELIHTDICGPMKTPSLGSQKYFLIFIDDFSRMTWVYFLKEKSEAFATFNKFKALVEKKKCCSIKIIRSHRRGEYTSRESEEYCKNEGIQKKHTVGYTPQQNCVSKRRNRTFVEMVRNMMNEKRLQKHFWVEVVDTTIHILNRCPTKALKD